MGSRIKRGRPTATTGQRNTAIALGLLVMGTWEIGTGDTLDPNRIVEARQASMTLASIAMPVIAAMVTGRAAYDPDRALALSGRVASLAATSTELFPPGSGSSSRTRARASVWRDKQRFDSAMQDYARLAEAMVVAARARSLETLREPALRVAQACRSCHRDYADLD